MIKHKPKIIRMTTLAVSMNIILKGQLRFMNTFFEVIGVTSYNDKHFNDCREREGIRMIPIEMARTVSVIKDIASLWRIYRLFKNERPQIVHTHTPKAGLLGMMAAWAAGVPIRMHTVAGLPLLEVRGIRRVILNLTERITFACATRVYPNSHGMKDIIEQNRFCRREKLNVIANGASNGINVDYFSPSFSDNPNHRNELRNSFGIASDSIVFCFVGRVAREKGIRELVEAFSQMISEGYNNIRLLLIGTFEKHYGMLDKQLEDSITSNPNIIHPGRFDDVRPFYLMSDVFTFPSYREGFPNAVLEAAAMSLPCIVTNINGCNEIITDEVNGIIIPAKDKESLKNAMIKMMSTEQRSKLAGNARASIVDRYKRELIWDALHQEYITLLKQNGDDFKI